MGFELSLQFMNSAPNTIFTRQGSSGISQPPATIPPSTTTSPPVSATSDFQIKGYVTYGDGNGGAWSFDFYIPVLGSNKFGFQSNPPGRYACKIIGDQSGWNLRLVVEVSPGSGDDLTPKELLATPVILTGISGAPDQPEHPVADAANGS